MKRNYLLLTILFLSSISLEAQENTLLPNEGKMLTTVMVLGAILLGIFLFLFLLERRLTKLENQITHEQ